VDTSSHPSVFISHYKGHGIKLVKPLSTVDNTRDYARVSHSRQWSNYNLFDQIIYASEGSYFRRISSYR